MPRAGAWSLENESKLEPQAGPGATSWSHECARTWTMPARAGATSWNLDNASAMSWSDELELELEALELCWVSVGQKKASWAQNKIGRENRCGGSRVIRLD